MITALLMRLLIDFISFLGSLLPAVPDIQDTALYTPLKTIMSLAFSLDWFLPLSTAVVPIIILRVAIANYAFAYRMIMSIINVIRGSGAK